MHNPALVILGWGTSGAALMIDGEEAAFTNNVARDMPKDMSEPGAKA